MLSFLYIDIKVCFSLIIYKIICTLFISKYFCVCIVMDMCVICSMWGFVCVSKYIIPLKLLDLQSRHVSTRIV